MQNRFPRLSSDHYEIRKLYDVIVIGSGYGASIAASRCARAGQKVCVLERGKEWLPGEFPEKLRDASSHMQATYQGKKGVIGDPNDLYEFVVSNDISVLQGCGLGGGSLINANVALDADPKVFESPVWPKELREDLKNLNDVDRKHFYDMIQPRPYPDSYPSLPKTEAMRRAAEGLGLVDVEDLGKVHRKLDLYVNFDGSKPNPLGIHQPACNNCGNCCGGCNTGAKNTLNMNYLPDAKAHGAQIFTEIEVTAVTRDSYAAVWRVHYKRNISVGGFKEHEQVVRAKYVILGAGALGSTKILLKSKRRGLDVSDRLGKGFTGNGDVLGFSYHSENDVCAIGLESGVYDKVHPSAPGPAITSVIDLRTLPDKSVGEGIVIQDGTPPGITKIPYSITMAIASKVLGVRKFPSKQKMEKLFERLKGDDIDKTLAFLCMSHDDAGGEIALDPKTDGIYIKWDKVGKQKNFVRVNEKLEEITKQLGGTFVINPLWSKNMGRELITAHPLGGCSMGENGVLGVVNHKGQVFDGDSKDVHPGLYVMDGSILPCSVGVNPTLSISILAERCVRLLIQDAGWKIDYEHFKVLDKINFEEEKPGIRFTERMVGDLTFKRDSETKTNAETVPCEFTLTIQSDDVEEMIENDLKHRACIAGTVTCKRLSDEPMTVSSGAFQLFSKSEEIVDAKEMLYNMSLSSVEGVDYYFHGQKVIKDDEFGETGLKDTTTLFTKIYKGENDQGRILAEGVLKMKPSDFYKQLKTIEIINTESTMEKLKWKTKFSNFFAKELWDTYSGISNNPKFDPDAPPRERRELKLDIIPEVHKCITEDKMEIKLTRFNGGGKGPLLVWHGMGMTSEFATLDTIDVNLVEFFVSHNYDLWNVDWRSSPRLPAASSLQYSIDDVANYDIPAAVVKVLEVTGQKSVQILAHCVAALGLFTSLLAGKLVGKIRNVVASQVGATPKGAFSNRVKANGRLTGLLTEGLNVKSVTTNTDKNITLKGRMFNSVAKTVTNVTTASDEKCSSDICHRVTFFYGLLWEHENLNALTHDIIHEIFGPATSGIFNHVSKVMRKNRLVRADGKDVYLPGVHKKDRVKRNDYRRQIEYLNLPIALFGGAKNNSFNPQNLRTFYELLKEAHPNQSYDLFYIPGYGHLDCFIGKNAHRDVWPKLLSVFDKYAQDDVAKDKAVIARVHQALNRVRLVTRKGGKQGGVLNTVTPFLRPENEVTLGSANLDDSDDDEIDDANMTPDTFARRKFAREISMQDAKPEQVHEKREHLQNLLPDEQSQIWYRKYASKKSLHKEPSYHPPESDGVEEVAVRRFTIPEASSKREIFILSDLHMGGEWSLEIRSRLEEFLKTLAKTADHYVHSLILLGDIFEMWMTPLAITPPTVKDFLQKWRSDEAVQVLVTIVRKLIEDDGVNVFYVRGNHDHEIDEETVKILFGEKVQFVAGKLIYIINNGVQEYRIRFEHGHDYDLFNCFSLVPPGTESPLCGHPFGYYVTRCCASSTESYFSDTEEILQNILRWFLSTLPTEVVGSTIAEILASKLIQKRLCESMLEQAFDQDITGDECVLLENDKWVKLKEIFNYRFIKEAIKKYGSSRVFSMLKASLGDFNDFLSEFGEDVVVIGHTHYFCCAKSLTGRAGNLYYANSGTWIDLVEHFSYVKVVPPTANEDGSLEVNYKLNDVYTLKHKHSESL